MTSPGSYEVIEFVFKPTWSNYGIYMLNQHAVQLSFKLMKVAIINKNTDMSTGHTKYPTSICKRKVRIIKSLTTMENLNRIE